MKSPEEHAGSMDRVSPTRRPDRSPIGYQTWRDLLFVHWAVPVSSIRDLLPASLRVDTFDGTAWVGLVPFSMQKVRPWWFPPVPGISNFLETNVRTYVHLNGSDPGVWFFSLEASNALAVRVARWKWQLPYFKAIMSLSKTEEGIRYSSQRLWPEPSDGQTELTVRFPETSESRRLRRAELGTFEHFLVERYYLYTTLKNPNSGKTSLLRGQVHHKPYEYFSVDLEHCQETLTKAAGIMTGGSPQHVAFSPGVDVEIFPLLPVSE